MIHRVVPPKTGPIAFGRNGALGDQKYRRGLPKHQMQGLEIMSVRRLLESLKYDLIVLKVGAPNGSL
jgi:hypothetical protein